MTTTIIFSQIFGIMFVIMGLSMFINKTWTSEAVAELITSKGLLWIAGLFTIVLGATVVTLHNNWSNGMPFIITLLGWMTLLKGAIIFLFPNLTHSYYLKVNKDFMFMYGGIILFLGGAYMLLL